MGVHISTDTSSAGAAHHSTPHTNTKRFHAPTADVTPCPLQVRDLLGLKHRSNVIMAYGSSGAGKVGAMT